MELKAHELFELKRFVKDLDKEQLGVSEGSKYKAIANRQNLKRALARQNRDYEDDFEALIEEYQQFQRDMQEFRAELGADEDKDKAEKQEEMNKYIESQDKALEEKTEELGFDDIEFVGSGQQQAMVAERDEEIEFEFDEGYEDRVKSWLKDLVEEHGPEGFNREEDLIAVGEELGIEG